MYTDMEKKRKYHAKHYQENKELYKARSLESRKRLRKERQEYVRNLKTITPCADCDTNYPYWIMDFDHYTGDKDGQISRMVSDQSMKKLKAEIAKCEIVCSNCHRERTHQRASLAE